MARQWYILRTYTQYEKKVEGRLQSLFMEKYKEVLLDVKVPVEEVETMKDSKRKLVEKKLWPGYVMLELDLHQPGWKDFITEVKSIPGAAGFLSLAADGRPLPLNDSELSKILQFSQRNVRFRRVAIEFLPGDKVQVTQGPFKSFQGTVEEVDEVKQKLKVNVQIFGRATALEAEFGQVIKVVE